jgi:bifunctional polynucleotide phosphatase/kinase
LYDQVPGKLNDASEKENMKIVIFTNQKGISTGKQALQPFKNKIEAIAGKLRAPIQVFVLNF